VVEIAPVDGHGSLEAPLHLLPLGDFDGVDVALVELLVNCEYEMSTVSGRRFAANWTSAMEPTISSAQKESVRSVRAPAEFARRRDAVGHRSGSLRTGRCRKFSA